MRHKLFEAVLCEKLKCTSRDISRHLQRVQSLSIHDTTLSLVYRSESGQLFSEDTQVVAEMLMQDISQFRNLKDISLRAAYSPSDFGNKLFAHQWPYSLETVSCKGDIYIRQLLPYLERLENLTSLTLTPLHMEIGELPAAVLGRLRYLNTIGLDVRQLSAAKSLEILRLEKPLHMEELPMLENVRDFRVTGILDLRGIGNVPNMERLTAEGCAITDIAEIIEVPGLKELNLSHNYIFSVDALGIDTDTVEVLNLSDNLIENIDHMGGSNLLSLDISHNPLHEISKMCVFRKMKYLDIRDTYVDDILPLLELSGLREIWLDVEKLRDRRQLADLPAIQRINGKDYGEALWFYKINR